MNSVRSTNTVGQPDGACLGVLCQQCLSMMRVWLGSCGNLKGSLFLPVLLQVTKQLGGVVQGLDKVLASMDLEKVRGICRGTQEW